MTNDELLQIIEQSAKDESTQLDLSSRGLTSLPAEIGKLVKLRTLNLSINQLASLPSEIGQLTNLRALDLSINQLASLPNEIGQLINLSTLYLGVNELTSLPNEIGQLVNLCTLDLSINKLTSLPSGVGQLTNLITLHLSSNELTSLPAEIGQLTNVSTLSLRDNPLPSFPLEIRKRDAKEILNFYRQQLEQKTDFLYEAKLLILGEGGAGKTTLAKKICNEDYQLQNEDSTKGIDVLQCLFPLSNSINFRVNIWDFGGQEIYHATHQFFLTKRSLYALVADTRKEDTDFYYWLNAVELLSDNSPLLIIKNEKEERQREINERHLRGEFTNLKEIISANFATNRGLQEISMSVLRYVMTLPHIGTELPRAWITVREALEQEQSNYISLDEYFRICHGNGFIRQEDALQLSSYLHDLGVCLHFQEDDLLMRTVILKPNWGTDAVYKVLDNSQVVQNLGKFNRNDLATIWHEDKYANMRPELLKLMMNFKLCYEIPSRPGVYIAPQLLSPNQPEYSWDESDNLFLRYEYEFMPKGIITRFIVEMHSRIEQQTCVWKTGVVLSKDNAIAEVTELYRYHKGEIRIRVTGNRKRDLLTTVRHELDEIHDSYERLRYNTLVPCNCDTCKNSRIPHFYQLQVLHRFLDNRQYQIQCQGSFQMVDVRGLIDDVIPKVSNSSSQLQRSQQRVDSLQEELELRTKKLRQLRRDFAIATETTRKFELEQQIEAEEAALAQLTEKLDDIEQQLGK